MDTNRETVARIEFRFRQHEEHVAQRLVESAREAGRSPCDHARELVKNGLTSTEQLQHSIHTLQQEVAQLHLQLRQLTDVAEALRTLHENVFALREDIATYAIKLLTDAGRVEPKAARKWVEGMLHAD